MGEFDDWDELGPPEMRPVPEGRPRTRRALVIVGVVLAGLILAGAGAWFAAHGAGRPAVPALPAATTPTPTNVTESFTVTASGGASSSTVVTMAPGTTSTVAVGTQRYTRGTLVAFRQDGALWVSEESGAGERKVATSAAGAFALSPDGATLAFVDDAAKTLAVADVASSRVTTVGPADVKAPVWSPSSKWLAFTNGLEVRAVSADGSGIRFLGRGAHPAISPDDATYAFAADGGGIVVVDGKDRQHKLPVKGRIDDVALGSDRLFYALGGASRSAVSLHSAALDGSGDRQLAGVPDDKAAGRYDELTLSPDGTWLAYATAGDDLHSRLRAMHVDGTLDSQLSLRHDGYLLRWSSDGGKVLFIDGNVLQGDATQLMCVRPDGTMRLTLLKGPGI
jgi:hypothetical protein